MLFRSAYDVDWGLCLYHNLFSSLHESVIRYVLMSICLHSFVRKYLKSLWFDGCGIENLAEFICHNENFCNFVHYEHDDKSIFYHLIFVEL